MNTYPLTDANLALIEKDFADAKLGGWTTVRILVTPAEMFSGNRIHVDLLDKLRALRTKYGRKICALFYVDVAPQGFWVDQIADGRDPDDVFNEWKNEDRPNRSWKMPEGVPVELEQPVINAFKEIADYLKPDYAQPGNEEGDTVDADRANWDGAKPGSINERFKSFQRRLVEALKGHVLISCAWETQNEATFAQQVDSGEGFWVWQCPIIGQNQYFVRWETGDTPQSVAVRFWAKVRECSPYRMPVAVTEGNVPGVPPALEMATFLAIRKAKPSWVKFFCPFLWSRA